MGTYRFTQSISDKGYATTCVYFPELNIIQPQLVCIKADQAVEGRGKITNLDSSTGYDYNTGFAPSSHIPEVLAERHCVLVEKTAGGEITYHPLYDESQNKYADSDSIENATNAVLAGSEGGIYVYEPRY